MSKRFTEDDADLLGALGAEAPQRKQASRTPREERIIAGFEEIQRFVEEHGRPPQHGEGSDIFERLYAVRLDRIRELEDCRHLVAEMDHRGLLEAGEATSPLEVAEMDDEALLDQLGVFAAESDLTKLDHVRPYEERRAADEVASRKPCPDFSDFEPLFQGVQRELDTGIRETRPFERKADIEAGTWFVVGGQKAYVAAKGETTVNDQGRTDARLRVIFDNGTESNMLMRSLQRALHKDEAGRRITDPVAGPLFLDAVEGEDQPSGTIYVLRSQSDHPSVAENRAILHKIGVTGGTVERRIANARLEPTYLLADVEVVATFNLYNINRARLESLLHRIFEPARADFEILDRFGRPFRPREWFLVPFEAIAEAVDRIKDGSITRVVYDPRVGRLVERSGGAG